MTFSGDAVLAVVGTLGGVVLGFAGSLLIWKLQRRAEKADRLEDFQRENLLKLLDLLQEYYIAIAEIVVDAKGMGQSFYGLRVGMEDCRARATDEKLRALIKTMVTTEVDDTMTDRNAITHRHLWPTAPVRERIHELLRDLS